MESQITLVTLFKKSKYMMRSELLPYLNLQEIFVLACLNKLMQQLIDSNKDLVMSDDIDSRKKLSNHFTQILALHAKRSLEQNSVTIWLLKDFYEHCILEKLQNLFNTRPDRANQQAVAQWERLPSLNIGELVKKGMLIFDTKLKLVFDLKIGSNTYKGQVDNNGKPSGIGQYSHEDMYIYEG